MVVWPGGCRIVRRFSTRYPFIAARAAVVSDEVLASQAGLGSIPKQLPAHSDVVRSFETYGGASMAAGKVFVEKDVLRRGGNATDAVIAMSACMHVLQPYTAGVGGDCFALYYDGRTKNIHCVDGSGRSPAALTLEKVQSYIKSHGSIWKQASGLYATVPGATKAWFDMASQFGSGKLSLSELFDPAITHAERGFPMDHTKQSAWRLRLDRLQRIPGGRFFLDQGSSIPRLGQTITNRPLAALLKKLAREGPQLVYEGPVAQAIVDAVRQAGGVLGTTDLAEHLAWAQPLQVEPVSTTYRKGVRVHTTPLPTQGAVLLEALNILEGFDMQGLRKTTGDFEHVVIEALRHAVGDGLRHVADTESGGSLQEMLSKERAGKLREKVKLYRRDDSVYPELISPLGLSGTTFTAAADDAGNVCAMIGSISSYFGCAVVEEHGFAVQVRGSGFNLEPGHPNCFGPRKKPYHTLMPIMVTDAHSNEFLCTMGAMAGLPQTSILTQVLLNMVELGLDPQQALARPRFVVGSAFRMHPDGPLTVDPDFPEDAQRALTRRGHVVRYEHSDIRKYVAGICNVLAKGERWWMREGTTGSALSVPGAIWCGTDPHYAGAALGY